MTGSDNAAIARLEVQFEHVLAAQKEQAKTLETVTKQLGDVRDTLAQSKGGLAVMKWLGFTSLGALLGTAAALYHWIKGG